MPPVKPIKVLAVGDVNGKFDQLIKKLNIVNKKSGPFDLLFCVGEFFGPDASINQKLTNGEISFPIPTYILGSCCPSTSQYYPENNAEELSPNVTYLGRKGTLTTATGLTIAYMSGIEATGNESRLFEFDEKMVDDLLLLVRAQSGFLGVDILLTSVWPAEISKYSSNTPIREIQGSKLLSRLATGLKPRYHFAGQGCHYERTPYRNHRVLVEPAQHTTRFISLASIDNSNKEKWIYAFNLVPMRKMSREELTTQPPNASEFPYMDILQEYLFKKRQDEVKKPSNQFFFDMNADLNEEDPVDRGERKRRNDYSENPRAAKQSNISSDNCWFCLSNSKTERHLIISICERTYMAMPKGPLTDDHVMIVSKEHIQSMVAADDFIREEISKIKDALTLMANSEGKAIVYFERNYKSSHMQLQVIPVPKNKAKALKSAFLNAAQEKQIEMMVMKQDEEVWDMIFEGTPYFFVELPDGTKLFTRQMNKFPLQFGREVLASEAIFNCEDKIDWKDCVLDDENEIRITQEFKEKFKKFNPFDDVVDSVEES